MPFVIKCLGIGTATSGTPAVYTVTSPALGAIVNNIRITNTSFSGAATINVYYRSAAGQTPYRIFTKDFSLAQGFIEIIKPELTLATSQLIEITTNITVDYVISGTEQY